MGEPSDHISARADFPLSTAVVWSLCRIAITIVRTCGMARLSFSGKPICACEFAFCLSVRYALYSGRDIWCISYRQALPDSVCSSQRISPLVSRDRRILCSNALVLSYNISMLLIPRQGQSEIQADSRKSLIFLIIPSLVSFAILLLYHSLIPGRPT